MTLVVDASVALKWVLDEPDRDAADALGDERLLAPDLWLVEAANALWRRVHSGDITAAMAARLLAELENAPVETSPLADDLHAALDLANTLRHPVYDCLYLALALRQGAVVVTADRRFYSAAQSSERYGPRVRLLGAPSEPHPISDNLP